MFTNYGLGTTLARGPNLVGVANLVGVQNLVCYVTFQSSANSSKRKRQDRCQYLFQRRQYDNNIFACISLDS